MATEAHIHKTLTEFEALERELYRTVVVEVLDNFVPTNSAIDTRWTVTGDTLSAVLMLEVTQDGSVHNYEMGFYLPLAMCANWDIFSAVQLKFYVMNNAAEVVADWDWLYTESRGSGLTVFAPPWLKIPIPYDRMQRY